MPVEGATRAPLIAAATVIKLCWRVQPLWAEKKKGKWKDIAKLESRIAKVKDEEQGPASPPFTHPFVLFNCQRA